MDQKRLWTYLEIQKKDISMKTTLFWCVVHFIHLKLKWKVFKDMNGHIVSSQ